MHVVNNFAANVASFRLSDGAWIGDLVPSGSGLVWPEGLERTPDGDILVASPGNARIFRFDGTTGAPLGTFSIGHGAAGTVDVTLVPARCPADVNNDAAVGLSDVISVLSAWGPCAYCPSDVNANGTVELADLISVISSWGACPS